MRFLSLIVLTLLLTSCAAPQQKQAQHGPVQTMNADQIIDPDNSVLRQGVQDFLTLADAPRFSQYEFSRLDLDSDGRRDALVLLKNPYGFWCGRDGCTLLVMKADNDSFELVNAVQPVRAPLHVSTNKTNGWSDIIARISGHNIEKAKDVVLSFDGLSYPDNPTTLPPSYVLAGNDTTKVFP